MKGMIEITRAVATRKQRKAVIGIQAGGALLSRVVSVSLEFALAPASA